MAGRSVPQLEVAISEAVGLNRSAQHPEPIDGVPASRVRIPASFQPGGPQASVGEFLIARFPKISRACWKSRCLAQRVLDQFGHPLHFDAAARPGMLIHYYREVAGESDQCLSGNEAAPVIVHQDNHLLVADKPGGMPVQPAGRYAARTLLAQLIRQTGDNRLVPLHRIDRDTSGLVLFSRLPQSRPAYHQLFVERRIGKSYLALAPTLPGRSWPQIRRSRIVRGEPFFRMREVAGPANSESLIERLGGDGKTDCYRLSPVSGRKHQLRVHMSALGAPICGDRLYPDLAEANESQSADAPLQLLAQRVEFTDPISGLRREFRSQRELPL